MDEWTNSDEWRCTVITKLAWWGEHFASHHNVVANLEKN